MTEKMRIRLFLLFACCMASFTFSSNTPNNLLVRDEVSLEASDILKTIYKVNTYWQAKNPNHGRPFWDRSAYHTGNMAVYKLTKDRSFLEYSIAFAEQNNWKGATSDNKEDWKYSYGESSDYVLFGDWQTCFQVYADLYAIEPKDYKIARAREVMEYQMGTPNEDYWWWVDALYMVMPVMTRLYKLTDNPLYLEKLQTYWQHTNSIMYDEEEGLYYRDANYIYPQHTTNSGKKDFWSRGNGWAFAALAQVLTDLPKSDQYIDAYIAYFRKMAKKLVEAQQEEGYWTRSVLDPDYVPGYETSGSAFFTYGLLWGINNGYLSDQEYGEAARKGWYYLSSIALQENGRVGYVQPIGGSAVPGQYIDINSTADFGVGAFLLAATEMYKYVGGDASTSDVINYISLPSTVHTDIIMPSGVLWSSSDAEILSPKGLVSLPQEDISLILTADNGSQTKDFHVTVAARNVLENNIIVHYTFDTADKFTENETTYLRDKSPQKNNARIYGNTRINGTLDLTENTQVGFSTNGYLMILDGVIDSLRSYTVLVKLNPSRLDNLPRVYDFGSASSNSTFGRLDALSLGMKYNGETTHYINSSQQIQTNQDIYLAFTFDAKSKIARIYVNGETTAEGTVAVEPYQLSLIGTNTRNYIGRTQWWDTNVARSNADFCGTIDDFYLFDVALAKGEIEQIQKTGNTGLSSPSKEPGIILYPASPRCNEEIYIDTKNNLAGTFRGEVLNTQGVAIISKQINSFPASLGSIGQSGFYLIRVIDNLLQEMKLFKLAIR